MIIHSVIASNFGSYEYVAFQPDNQGLCLIYGATGCGKSTLPDIISWGLFGVTAKDGKVDDVRNWSNYEEGTETSIVVTTKNGDIITVDRIRGPQNDLYWTVGDDPTFIRGRTISESQSILNEYLGTDATTFTLSSYFNELSPASNFFLSSAKARRELLEKIIDLSLPVKVAERTAEKKKAIKAEIKPLQSLIDRLIGAIDQNKHNLSRIKKQAADWDTSHKADIDLEVSKATRFEELKASKIKALETKSNNHDLKQDFDLRQLTTYMEEIEAKLTKAQSKYHKCDACGTLNGAEEVATLKGKKRQTQMQIDRNKETVNPFLDAIEMAHEEQNHSFARVAELRAEKNPHHPYLKDLIRHLSDKETELTSKQEDLSKLNEQISVLDQLYELSFDLRGALLQNAISQIEEKTNKNLETYFDSEFRVSFKVEGGDALEVDITKNGHACVYKQLSKGQRQLLKLSFSVSIMEAAANTAGIHFDQLFLDEALDGLDSTLKVKAFDLFENLAQNHGSVFIIEHAPEFQEMCSNKWKVTMKGEHSELEYIR